MPLALGQWAYRCAFQDAYTRQVVGWQVLATMPEDLVTSALRRALLHCHQAVRSQSRRGKCPGIAQAESLWSRLKTEELEQRDRPAFRDLADARHSVATYFDYYNYERRHSARTTV